MHTAMKMHSWSETTTESHCLLLAFLRCTVCPWRPFVVDHAHQGLRGSVGRFSRLLKGVLVEEPLCLIPKHLSKGMIHPPEPCMSTLCIPVFCFSQWSKPSGSWMPRLNSAISARWLVSQVGLLQWQWCRWVSSRLRCGGWCWRCRRGLGS
jgi:hypothetical protein